MTKFKVTPTTAHERNRINEHGELWEISPTAHVNLPDKKFLRSVKSQYDRWWSNEQLEEVKHE